MNTPGWLSAYVEDLGLLRQDRGAALDEWHHDTTSGLHTEREGSDIEEQNFGGLLGGVTGEDDDLDGSAERDSLIGFGALVGLLAVEEVGDELDNARDGWRTISCTCDLSTLASEDLLDGFRSRAEGPGRTPRRGHG